MQLDLLSMDADQLQKLVADAQAALEKQNKINKLRADIIEMITTEGYTVDQIFPSQRLFEVTEAPKRRGRKPKAETPEGFERGAEDRRASVAPKYRNPLNAAETWTGRGKRPRWIEPVLASGMTLDDLLIDKPAAPDPKTEAAAPEAV